MLTRAGSEGEGPVDGEVGGWVDCDGCVGGGVGEVECGCEGKEEGEEGEEGWGWHVERRTRRRGCLLPALGVLAT